METIHFHLDHTAAIFEETNVMVCNASRSLLIAAKCSVSLLCVARPILLRETTV